MQSWKNIENKFWSSDILAEAELTKKLMGLTIKKREDLQNLENGLHSFNQGLKIKLKRRKDFRGCEPQRR